MAKNTQTPYERALARAAADHIRVVADFGDHWRVRGSDGVTLYEVRLIEDEELACTCRTQAGILCKHIAMCVERRKEQQAETAAIVAEALAQIEAREAVAAEASAALVLVERSERVMAGERQERMLLLASCWPVTSLLVAAGIGRAEMREVKWQAYQDARRDNFAA